MNRRVLLFGDVWAEDSAPVNLDRRVDDFRAINSITPPEQIVSDLGSGRKFFHFLHYLTAAFFLRKLAALRRAPVAQLDRASDYGFKPNEVHTFSLLCIPSRTLGGSVI